MHKVEPVDYLLLQKKLLLIASSGKFTQFTPEQLLVTYDELNEFLIQHTNKLDSIDLFNLYELNIYLGVSLKNFQDAKVNLDRITDQFGNGKGSQRIRILQSIYYEGLKDLKKSSELLTENPNELKLSRRLTTSSRRSKSNEPNDKDDSTKYISNLIYYLGLQPSDLITWSELSTEYCKIGDYKKAVFCLKEIVLQDTLAYPIYYKIGLLNYYQFLQIQQRSQESMGHAGNDGVNYNNSNKNDKEIERLTEFAALLTEARNNFLYSIEINENYKKSWIGLFELVTSSSNYYNNHRLVKSSNKLNEEIQEYLRTNEKLKPKIVNKLKQFNLLQ